MDPAELLRRLRDNLPDVVYEWRLAEGGFAFVSGEIGAFTGRQPEELTDAARALACVHPDDRSAWVGHLTSPLDRPPAVEVRWVHRDGSQHWAEHRSRLVRDAHGHPYARIGVARDVSSLKAAEESLVHRASHDGLTGLANRIALVEAIERKLAEIGRTGATIGVAVFDLDRFKEINDSLGHSVGDQLLLEAAARLAGFVKTGDRLARLGGDQFGMLFGAKREPDEVISVADDMCAAFSRAFHINGEEIPCTVSAGLIFGVDAHVRPDELLRDSETAMYRAKDLGRGRVELFADGLRAQLLANLNTRMGLRRAIDRDELRVYYQPEVDVSDGSLLAFEALVRWDHPERGLLAPGEFMAVAEESGQIRLIGDWVLREACRQLAEWGPTTPEGRPLIMRVNLSALQLCDPALVTTVEEVLALTGCTADQLCLEITETMLMHDEDAVRARLSQLRELGVKIAIDDFGTGYSSLAYLRRFPFDIVKIDKSFIDELGHARESTAIVTSVIALTQALGIDVTAEGVETALQVSELLRLGCPRAQGFYFGRPMPAHLARSLVEPNRGAGEVIRRGTPAGVR